MAAVRINYQAQGCQILRFHESSAFFRTIIGPLGSGKTHSCIIEVLLQVLHQTPDRNRVRRSRVAVVRNTYIDLMNTITKDFREIVEQADLGTFKASTPPSWSAIFPLDDGTTVDAEVIFMAFDGPEDQRKARGLQLSGLYANELKELSKDNLDLLLSRVGRYPAPAQVPNAKHFVIADSNAPDRDHWLAKLVFDEKPKDYAFFIQPPAVRKVNGAWQACPDAENVHNLPHGYYDRLTQAKKDSWIRQNLANEFVFHSDGRPVHPDFSEHTHVGEFTLDPRLPLSVGIDFGRTPAATLGQKQHNGRWLIWQELVTENMSALRFGELLKKMIGGDELLRNYQVEFTGDPAGNQQAQTRDETPFDMLRASGIYAIPAPSNDFEQRTTALDVQLTKLVAGDPAILIHPRCKTLIKGLSGAYQFKRVKVAGDERYQDKPDKGPTSHVCESLHYMLTGAGEGWLHDPAMVAEMEQIASDLESGRLGIPAHCFE
ncbi:TerL [Parahaliea maris]|uniref:TerL n=1 Tax=Parahaliea maris TaxID=2716870 RepID=A0A5C8ZMT3_9GAMM|nr:TerL [Parahaliea maris]TXS89072.1 TerL [Parahaliea maris]